MSGSSREWTNDELLSSLADTTRRRVYPKRPHRFDTSPDRKYIINVTRLKLLPQSIIIIIIIRFFINNKNNNFTKLFLIQDLQKKFIGEKYIVAAGGSPELRNFRSAFRRARAH